MMAVLAGVAIAFWLALTAVLVWVVVQRIRCGEQQCGECDGKICDPSRCEFGDQQPY